jgi:hypothetical protein
MEIAEIAKHIAMIAMTQKTPKQIRFLHTAAQHLRFLCLLAHSSNISSVKGKYLLASKEECRTLQVPNRS